MNLRDSILTTAQYIRQDVSRILASIPHIGDPADGMEHPHVILEPLMNIAAYAERLDAYIRDFDEGRGSECGGSGDGKVIPITGSFRAALLRERQP